MEKRPRAVLLKFPGTNCDQETARALKIVGFDAEVVPIAGVSSKLFDGVSLAVFSGGFSYGDYVMSGRFASLITRQKISDTLSTFRDQGGYILGICNGFQILTQLGLLPEGSLIHNASGRFQCRWVTLENRARTSPFLANLPDRFEVPIAHAEGRFVTNTPEEARGYVESGLAALTYTEDINGSFERIAGMQDKTGRVFGMMPHPERFIQKKDHYDPDWNGDATWGSGYYLFESIYQAIVR